MHRESPNFGHLVVVLVFFSGFTETKKIEVEFGLSAQIDFKDIGICQIKELPQTTRPIRSNLQLNQLPCGCFQKLRFSPEIIH